MRALALVLACAGALAACGDDDAQPSDGGPGEDAQNAPFDAAVELDAEPPFDADTVGTIDAEAIDAHVVDAEALDADVIDAHTTPHDAGDPALDAEPSESDAGVPGLPLRNRRSVTLATSSETTISYGGYLNGESFQQDAILTYEGYQYAAYWNAASRVILARRRGGEGAWSRVEMDPTYTGTSRDAHNTISLGVSPSDGRLHVAFDHHGSPLHYVRSVAGLVSDPDGTPWATESFEPWTSVLGTTTVNQVTYPRFVSLPNGRMLFEYRRGSSGSGDQVLWEYDAGTWTQLGVYIAGIVHDVNAYPHGIELRNGRLHVTWCWRDTSNAATNHGLLYAYSDDHGRTWRNDEGTLVATTGSTPMTRDTAGILVWAIPQNRGLINQEHMTVDSAGRVHVLLSHMPDHEPNRSDFTAARARSEYFHYRRGATGWTRTALGMPVQLNFRGKLALTSRDDLYAVLPNVRIATASAANEWNDWTIVEDAFDGDFFSDPLIDRSRLLVEDVLTVFAPTAPAVTVRIETINYDLE